MPAQTYSSSLAVVRVAPPWQTRLADCLRAIAAAWTSWRQTRVAAASAHDAERELATLSAHVLRDIGVCEAASARVSPGASLFDLEIRR